VLGLGSKLVLKNGSLLGAIAAACRIGSAEHKSFVQQWSFFEVTKNYAARHQVLVIIVQQDTELSYSAGV